MKVQVNYEDTDVSQVLGSIIKHENKDEFIKLITPMICSSSSAATQLFRLLISGNKLPDVISNGTICKIHIDNLGYGANKKLVQKKYADADNNIIVRVHQFRGYHEYTNYEILYNNVNTDDSVTEEKTYVSFDAITVVEEF